MAAAAHRTGLMGSQGDAILADELAFLNVKERMPPRYPVNLQDTDVVDRRAAWDRMLHDYVRF
jgi:hypothetical protein